MKAKRTIVIGDVHGCIDELRELRKLLDIDPAYDQEIYAGDLIDRGPDPVGVVGMVRKIHAACVLGNHEEKAIRWRAYEALRISEGKKNPMRPLDDRRMREHQSFTDDDLLFLNGLPLFIRFEDGGISWIVTHAGVPSNKPIEEQEPRKLVRTRTVDAITGSYKSGRTAYETPAGSVYWSKMWKGPESVIHGHIVHQGVMEESPLPGVFCVGIDTGCCFGGSLTAAVFTGSGRPEFVSVKAKQTYWARKSSGESEGDT